MAREGVLPTEVAGVSGAAISSLSTADSASLAQDSLRNILGRVKGVVALPCALGVRVCRVLLGMRVLRPTAWASKVPFLVDIR